MEVLYHCFYVMLMPGNQRTAHWTSAGHRLYPRLRLLFEDALGEWTEVRPSRREMSTWLNGSTLSLFLCNAYDRQSTTTAQLVRFFLKIVPLLLPREPKVFRIEVQNLNGAPREQWEYPPIRTRSQSTVDSSINKHFHE